MGATWGGSVASNIPKQFVKLLAEWRITHSLKDLAS